MARARHRFYELDANHQSQIGGLELFGALYGIDQTVADLPADARRLQAHAKPITESLHRWLIAQRQRVPDGSGNARAIAYSLKRWEAVARYLDEATLRSTIVGSRSRSGFGRSDARTSYSRARAPCSVRTYSQLPVVTPTFGTWPCLRFSLTARWESLKHSVYSS